MKRTRTSKHRDLPRFIVWLVVLTAALGTIDFLAFLLLSPKLALAFPGLAGLGIGWAAAFALHSFSCALVYALFTFKRGIRVRDQVSLQPLYTMALFLPGIGLMFISLLLLFLFIGRYDDQFFTEYENYVYYTPDSLETYVVHMDKANGLVPVREILQSGSHDSKKEALFSLLQYEGSAKVALFQEALRDQDPEVVHYAATSLNYLNESYVLSLKRLTQALKEDELSLPIWSELLETYEHYLESRLLSAELAAGVEEAWSRLIERGQSLFPTEPMFTAFACRAALWRCDYKVAERYARTLGQTPAYRYLAYAAQAEALYSGGQFEELQQLARRWQESGEPIPDRYASAVELWKEMNGSLVPQTQNVYLRYR
ncbi:hypothetical protein [Paenibacillus sp. YYML68]|uniref:hypothetical protein n=1 Tax=Paenibacillus sp. YYML68 TaxID=2909250 RepID=UPI0024909064|nr:hypothetical protein [Paenibacillus sp. YYML68]